MWKKFVNFKKSGMPSISRYHQLLFIVALILSNTLFYLLAMPSESKQVEKALQIPLEYSVIKVEAKLMLSWQAGQKVSLFDEHQLLIVQDAFLTDRSHEDGLVELMVPNQSVFKLIERDKALFVLPHYRHKTPKKLTRSQGENYEIHF